MISKVIQGNLIKLALQGRYDVIVHGCNCMNTMGAGIARSIRQQFPQAYAVDQKTMKGDRSKLGTYTSARVDVDGFELVVVNAYTQYGFAGRNNVDYKAIKDVFTEINNDFSGKRIGIPKIGAGLAGGNWNKIEEIINEVSPNISIELVEFKP